MQRILFTISFSIFSPVEYSSCYERYICKDSENSIKTHTVMEDIGKIITKLNCSNSNDIYGKRILSLTNILLTTKSYANYILKLFSMHDLNIRPFILVDWHSLDLRETYMCWPIQTANKRWPLRWMQCEPLHNFQIKVTHISLY